MAFYTVAAFYHSQRVLTVGKDAREDACIRKVCDLDKRDKQAPASCLLLALNIFLTSGRSAQM